MIYSLIPEVFHPAYASETRTSDIEAMLALGGVEVGRIAVLPAPGDLGSWLAFERNGCCVVIPDTLVGDNIHGQMHRSGS